MNNVRSAIVTSRSTRFCCSVILMTLLLLAFSNIRAQHADQVVTASVSWSNIHFVYDDQPIASEVVTAEAASVMPSILMTGDFSEIQDVDMNIPYHQQAAITRNIETAYKGVVYDNNGNIVLKDIEMNDSSKQIVKIGKKLKAGTYYLHVTENGKMVEKEKFEVK